MKRSIFFLIGFFLSTQSWAQPCLPNGITFHTQSQVDSFAIYYPDCSGIEGNVVINGTNITDLNGLNSITDIGGYLVIFQSDSLTTLAGLENLVSIEGDFTIFDNHRLNSVNGMEKLTTVMGSLHVSMNDALPFLVGLDSLGFIGGDIQINENYELTSVKGLESLTSIGGGIGFWDNPILTDLSALEGLTSIGGDLYFSDNNELTSLSGLDNIEAGSISFLHIFNNTNLSNCAVLSICNYLNLPLMFTEIHNNAVGCNSDTEVETACEALFVDKSKNHQIFCVYPNPTSNQITLEAAENCNKSLVSILNLRGQELIREYFQDQPRIEINVSSLAKGIYLLKMETKEGIETQKLVIQ